MKGVQIMSRTVELLLLFALLLPHSFCQTPNHYATLGVSPSASLPEIKAAYRRKARETHPDKRQDLSPEESAAQFHQVVLAFEILTDKYSRRSYDREQQREQTPRQYTTFHERRKQRVHNSWYQPSRNYQANDDDELTINIPEVQQAMARVMEIVSLSQLETILLNENGRLERNLLLCVVTPQTERAAQNLLLFPYPFAGWSTQKIWWDDLVQTLLVRYPLEDNNLRQLLKLPEDSQHVKEPLLYFAKRGDTLRADNLQTLKASIRDTFQIWVWGQFQVDLTFVNHHEHPVEIFWVHGTQGKLRATLQPGEDYSTRTHLSYEWRIRDWRVDRVVDVGDPQAKFKMTEQTTVATYKVLSDDPHQVFEIPNRPCMDLTSSCKGWRQVGECDANPHYMHEYCALSCDVCREYVRRHEKKDNLIGDEL